MLITLGLLSKKKKNEGDNTTIQGRGVRHARDIRKTSPQGRGGKIPPSLMGEQTLLHVPFFFFTFSKTRRTEQSRRGEMTTTERSGGLTLVILFKNGQRREHHHPREKRKTARQRRDGRPLSKRACSKKEECARKPSPKEGEA